MIKRRNAAIAVSLCLIFAIVAFGSQRTEAETPPDSAAVGGGFWDRMAGLCGNAYEGELNRAVNPRFIGNRMVMHVFQCEPDRIAIRVRNDDYNDRVTMVHAFIQHSDGRIELRHTYRNAGGTSAEITDHGGSPIIRGLQRRKYFLRIPEQSITNHRSGIGSG